MIGQFIHVLWGHTEASYRRRGGSRHKKAIRDLKASSKRELSVPATVYCFGESNRDYARELGYATRLCDREPIVFERDQFWRHKVAGWIFALQDFGCPVIHVDCDVRQVREIPEDHWWRMAQRESLQAVLEQMSQPKIFFRRYDQRKVNSGKFVYLRSVRDAEQVDRQFLSEDRHRRAWDETAITATIMDRLGGWHDDNGESVRNCIALHEPYCAVSRRVGHWKRLPEYHECKEKIFMFPRGQT